MTMSNFTSAQITAIDITVKPRRNWWQRLRRAVLQRWLAWQYARDTKKFERGEGIELKSIDDLFR
ncbi:MAG: hypothetical protein HW383_266 [Candidatus Magasanikbacteria bacterium]|nr:hypothetical protein [Candidatus Magasanikbacteria bacterium]